MTSFVYIRQGGAVLRGTESWKLRMSSASPSQGEHENFFSWFWKDLGQILKYTQIHLQNFNAFRLVLSMVQNCTTLLEEMVLFRTRNGSIPCFICGTPKWFYI